MSFAQSFTSQVSLGPSLDLLVEMKNNQSFKCQPNLGEALCKKFHYTPAKELQIIDKKTIDKCAIILQCFCRRIVAVNRVLGIKQARRLLNGMFRLRALSQLKVKSLRIKPKIRAAIVVQRVYRGYRARHLIWQRLHASFVISRSCKRYLLALSLQRSLRRIEHPIEIVIKGIKDIGLHKVINGSLRMVVSVWWFSLLHIISGVDLVTAIKTRSPQYVWQSPEMLTAAARHREVKMMDRLREQTIDRVKGLAAQSASPGRKKAVVANRSRQTALFDIKQHFKPKIYASHHSSDSIGFDNFTQSDNAQNDVTDCDFEDIKLIIPSCHGNTVIKFQLLDESRVIGTYTYFCGVRNKLCFWGGEETVPIAWKMLGRTARGRGPLSAPTKAEQIKLAKLEKTESKFFSLSRAMSFARGVSTKDISKMISQQQGETTFNLNAKRISALEAYAEENQIGDKSSSTKMYISVKKGERSEWCNLRVEGTGPLYRQIMGKSGILNGIFIKNRRCFVVLCGAMLYFFEKKNAEEHFANLPLSELLSVSVAPGESMHLKQIVPAKGNNVISSGFTSTIWQALSTSNENSFGLADFSDVVLSTSRHEIVHLRFATSKSRKLWVTELENALMQAKKLPIPQQPQALILGSPRILTPINNRVLGSFSSPRNTFNNNQLATNEPPASSSNQASYGPPPSSIADTTRRIGPRYVSVFVDSNISFVGHSENSSFRSHSEPNVRNEIHRNLRRPSSTSTVDINKYTSVFVEYPGSFSASCSPYSTPNESMHRLGVDVNYEPRLSRIASDTNEVVEFRPEDL